MDIFVINNVTIFITYYSPPLMVPNFLIGSVGCSFLDFWLDAVLELDSREDQPEIGLQPKCVLK